MPRVRRAGSSFCSRPASSRTACCRPMSTRRRCAPSIRARWPSACRRKRPRRRWPRCRPKTTMRRASCWPPTRWSPSAGASCPRPKCSTRRRIACGLLSGRSHRVYSGICLITPSGKLRQRLVETRVRFKRLSRDEIDAYLASGEWRGKAGGYAVQGLAGAFVVKLVGSYTNVVGLPLYETVALLAGEGFKVHANWSVSRGHEARVRTTRSRRCARSAPAPNAASRRRARPTRSARRAARTSTSTAGSRAPMSFRCRDDEDETDNDPPK